jgi:divalent metal cation (Fe/Co/Zn/Cd) transporter
VAEAAAAIAFSWLTGSVALIALGFDSAIELVAAAALVYSLRSELRGDHPERAERRERRVVGVVGWASFALAAFVTVDAVVVLARQQAVGRTLGGVVVAVLAAVVMPALGWEKLRVGDAIASTALVADAKTSLSCGVLAMTILLGVGLNTALGWWWADPVAALAVVPFLVHGGREALEYARGNGDQCG